MKLIFTILFFYVLFFTFAAENQLKIRVYSQNSISSVKLETSSGKYQVLDADNKVAIELFKGQAVQIFSYGSLLLAKTETDTICVSNKITFKGVGFMNIIEILPTKPTLSTRIYDDDFIVENAGTNKLHLINYVRLEHYVAGVVEAEAGIGKNEEFFKVQAVSARTFALKYINKHKTEGYNLCDATHCQVYKGRCSNTAIMLATSKTSGQVMVDDKKNLISAVFHSNSGGQTANSEDVWSGSTTYLRSVKDTFSINQRSYTWTKTISKDEWLSYLKKNYNYPIDNPIEASKVLNFLQLSRMSFLVEGISLRKVREDLGLKSTFFNISLQNDKVVFSGKGFGHGVGMSQEGAMQMANMGYSYQDILKFYYTGINLINLNELN